MGKKTKPKIPNTTLPDTLQHHPTIRVTVWDVMHRCERTFDCDRDIVNVILDLNRDGAVTEYSCQEFLPDVIQIGFSNRLPPETLMMAKLIIESHYPSARIIFSVNNAFGMEAYIFRDPTDKFEIPVDVYSKGDRGEDIMSIHLKGE